MRKAFKFYRSYWEVAQELNDKERLKFYDALLLKQFTGQDLPVDGMSKFAILSQRHSIDLQIDGYVAQFKKKHPNEDPWQGVMQGVITTPLVQEKEKEKEKENVTSESDFYFEKFWNVYAKKFDRSKCMKTFSKIKPDLYETIITAAEKYVQSTPEIKYRKNPLTWLNGQCWIDELPAHEEKIIKAFHPKIFD
jgi:hypothetical protein